MVGDMKKVRYELNYRKIKFPVILLVFCILLLCACAHDMYDVSMITSEKTKYVRSEETVDNNSSDVDCIEYSLNSDITQVPDISEEVHESVLSDDISVSDVSDAEQDEEISIHIHEYIETIVAPTCEKQGYTLFSCMCGSSYIDEYTDTIMHSWSSWNIIQDATTTVSGKKVRYCSTCNKKDTSTIEKKVAVDLSQISPSDFFAGMGVNSRAIIDAVIDFIDENYDKEFETTYIGIYEMIELSEVDFMEINTYFSFYFGSCDCEILTYTYYPDYCSVYIDIQKAFDWETDRRIMMRKLDNILYQFEAGSEEVLVQQVFDYLAATLSYESNQYDVLVALNGYSGNCNAYSGLFKLMLHRLGIQSDICIGYTSSGAYHAWNKVSFSNGICKYYDLTFYEAVGSDYYFGASSSFHNLVTLNRYLSASELNQLSLD